MNFEINSGDTGTEFINSLIVDNKPQIETDKISDTYHTFGELYHHRMILFSIICNQNKGKAWKSRLHDDGTMYVDYFIVGITTSEGEYTYHYHMDNWNSFDIEELTSAPAWDGHIPSDITRLLSLI